MKKVMAGLISTAILAVNMASLGANASEAYDYNQAPTMLLGQSVNMTSRTSNFYGYYLTPPMITGQTCKTPTVSIVGSNNTIYSDDFGVQWFEGVGLNTNFVRSTSRYVDMELYEEDEDGTDILVGHTKGHFTVGSDGVYTVSHFTGGDGMNTRFIVEYDNIAEVYMKLTVSRISGDKNVNIPAGMMVYGYWID